MDVCLIEDVKQKETIARAVLEQLETWFGIESSRENYIEQTRNEICFAVFETDKPVGFISLKKTSEVTLEVAVMGVYIDKQRKGYGHALLQQAEIYAKNHGYKMLQVKTVASGHYASYDQTNLFYQKEGFLPVEIFPTLWDAHNPCQLYVKCI
ncbi:MULTISPECIES: GNAT family N-acetyltransferase [unclassified Breznakia]|uniref:GNAT family N-acetyltransferase n=1 Tax=unclassified Breznakia TaxID=2623764 RepID=UPI0024745491|nr:MULTISPECIES: GNAT family N-acetyltransferase [unclassified Breznakia]MDH6367174.1 GNAT superfamily N-acetyltransferase [Breznakia sp. PH1-1]MDH6404406.1 GNAT superfamily N-acetyltransferase [Breznakia sp. PF1-11]MDH6412115.1 GNAT superfamily N-acetyltransferase [Breznakia sp. PFB1-11]MDH6414394.1 GNAT superfamily N-acetyltransferase [Breznakia sp. PFB1-14]MDH6416676.1 GNAT superfamily N-acetyltransferase [Breznakia sp. PFB1-4]